jgi:hypothetical protein
MSVTLAVLVALLLATVAVAVLAVRRNDGAAIVNAVVSLGVDAVAVGAATGFQFDGASFVAPALAVWTAFAGLIHSIGMLGPYESVWWWDHLTHTVSAALLAALVYAGLIATVGESWSPGLVAVATVAYTLAAGVVWELLELVARAAGERYGVEPVLVHYGWWDTGLDVAFDLLAAIAVVALDIRLFLSFAREAPATARGLLVWSTVAVLAVGALSGVVLVVRARQSV